MRSFLFALVTLVCACASSPQPQPEAAPTAPDSTATAAASAQPAPAQGSTGTATAEAAATSGAEARPEKVAPDSPEGQDAARIADLSKKAAPLVDAFINLEPQLTRDGQRAIFISNRDGLPQVYLADAKRPDAPAKRLFEWKERVSQVSTTPDGRSLLFLSDTGADENWSIWKVGLDGSVPVELTAGEKLNRDNALLPDLAPDTVYFSARPMSAAQSTVHAVPVSGGESRVVFQDDLPGFLTDVSRDGKHGLYVRYPSRSENYLVRVDLATGQTRPLYPREGKVSVFEARFSPDGKTVYVATDGGGEQAWLLALDAESGEEKARYVETSPTTAIIQGVEVSKVGGLVGLSLAAGNRSELRLLDGRTLKPRARIAMPLGQGSLGKFSEDGRRLTASWSTPTTPGDVWAVDTKTGKVSPLRREPRPTLQAVPAIDSSITSVRAHDGLDLPVNVYLPKKRTGKLPVIVSYHGGPSGSSQIRWSPATAFFLSQGYAWVEPNVRGSGGFGRAFEEGDNGPARLEAFKDIEATGRWAASQPWADPERVIIYGGSYGGYTVLVGLTRMPDLWRAGVDLFGVADLKTFMATTSGFIREIFLVEFGDPDKDAAFLESISPLKDVDRIVDPLFVYAGANDPRVPRSESDLIVRALRERKVPVEYMVSDNEGHSLARKENVIEFLSRSARFLEVHAAPAGAVGAR
ncbi:alpha/beta hydrolase family protein [Pyxidicoccus trucidator]|uniref:S9 family peptidase n=1 Tax=Pyxidicoccus trucidator TaxID=2709662 RepID=UPI0013D98252|nr:S9 family peptidase [Pyxidicoccus trucidator]